MDSVILFGASNLGYKAFNKMKKDYNIEFFCDNDDNKWGEIFNDKLIIKPSQLLSYYNYKIVISSSFIYPIGEQLDNMGIKNYYIYQDIDEYTYKLKEIKSDNITIDLFNKNKIYYISPDQINFGVKESFHNFYDSGLVVDGNWDKSLIAIDENNDFYSSFKEHIYDKILWQNTKYFKRVLKEINLGKTKWACVNEVEFLNKCEQWDNIFNDIKNNGYKQSENSDYVTINIDRNGNILFNDGLHRLIFAKILKIKSIPVKIVVRHKKWIDFKKQILNYANLNGGKIYAPINHLDLCDVKHLHEDRGDKIIKNISNSSKTILDIGAHWGYFDSILEDDNKQCTAVEILKDNEYFLKKIKIATGQNFRVVNMDIFEFIKNENKFDAVLALNIFHHFLKNEHLYYKLVNTLQSLDMNEMFFETHRQDEPQMKDAYINYNPIEFVEFIIKNSCLKKYDEIGDYNGRKLYHLTKK